MSHDILSLGARKLSDALQCGSLSSVEATGALLDRLDALQSDTLPMAAIWRDEALKMADESDARRKRGEALSPHDGLPVTLKENLDVAGYESTLGVHAKRGRPAERDAVVVQVLREAGCVFLGKSNVSQFLLSHECANPLFGTSNNPYDPARTPGGSSGGEAAAIASYGSPGGLGTDIGGSIRVPAHFCGIAGLKPTVDRISGIGVGTALPGQEFIRGQVGPLGREVDDLIVLMDILRPERCAALDPRVPPLPLGDPAAVTIDKLRVGVFVDDPIVSPSRALRRAVERAEAVLSDAGITLVPYTPPLAKELIFTYLGGMSADGGKTIEATLAGGPADDNLKLLRTMAKLPNAAKRAAAFGLSMLDEPILPDMLRVVGEKSLQDYWRLTARARAIQAQVYRAWNDLKLDAVLCPPHATPALTHGASRDFTLGGALAMRFNFLNLPAGVVPVTRVRPEETVRRDPQGKLEKRAAEVDRGSEGLPVGVQIVARPYREDVVLALLKVIEAGVRGDEGFPRVAS